jgi:hypothetical protein
MRPDARINDRPASLNDVVDVGVRVLLLLLQLLRPAPQNFVACQQLPARAAIFPQFPTCCAAAAAVQSHRTPTNPNCPFSDRWRELTQLSRPRQSTDTISRKAIALSCHPCSNVTAAAAVLLLGSPAYTAPPHLRFGAWQTGHL